jgi:polysaccharide export outer membrane protein
MRKVLFIFAIFTLASCVSHQKVTYFNDILEMESGALSIPDAPQPMLKKGDVLEIQISSLSLETNAYFQRDQSSSDEGFGGNMYQISATGKVHLPLVGAVKIAGLTVDEARIAIEKALLAFVQQPVVNVRQSNFKITILGEVDAPGVYEIPTGEATILEALGYAGDLTVYGLRENILVIRDNGEEKTFQRMNLNESNVMESSNFYLQNNDVIYVQPSKGFTSKDDNIYRILPLVISSLTFIAVFISLTQ